VNGCWRPQRGPKRCGGAAFTTVLGCNVCPWHEPQPPTLAPTPFAHPPLLPTLLTCSPSPLRQVADQLVSVAVHYGFEGWLLNIENTLPAGLVPAMLHFASYLRAAMHRAVPGALVIWYDAVTVEGWLEWQNGLTALNQPFMDACGEEECMCVGGREGGGKGMRSTE
jgi:hypothetical protein